MDDGRIRTGKTIRSYTGEVDGMDNFITREEHEEFCRRMESENKRLEDENDRQNNRINILEENSKQMQTLTTSVEKLAINMESMVRQIGQQGERLEALESRDGEMWRKAIAYLATAVIGAVVGYISKQIGV